MRISCVVVAYHPRTDQIEGLARSLIDSGASVVVVDNTEGLSPDAHAEGELTTIRLGSNVGIARALNVGIEYAASTADAVLLFDQDSLVQKDFIALLTAQLEVGEPGVVAPVALDKSMGAEYPSQRLTRFGYPVNVYARDASAPVRVDLVITSGMAITMATFAKVGLMDESLFIDYVDTEWCFRCRREHVPIHVVPAAMLSHAIGERSVQVGSVRTFIHGSVRSYYKLRNALLLLRRKHVPKIFALRQVGPAIVHAIMQLRLVPAIERSRYSRSFLAAFSDGIRGIEGKRILSENSLS
jgi:rhamnosyltransferase